MDDFATADSTIDIESVEKIGDKKCLNMLTSSLLSKYSMSALFKLSTREIVFEKSRCKFRKLVKIP